MILRNLTLVSLFFFALNMYAQDESKKIVIRGILKTDKDAPVKKASIYIDNKNTKRRTDRQGVFLIVCDESPKKIKFVHKKHGTKEIEYKGDSIMSIVMKDKRPVLRTSRYIRFNNIYDYLRGRPGVIVNRQKVYIRGINSFNSSTEPLILLNGTQVHDVSNVNINEVKRITILKKPDELATYGMRGANGVILIDLY
ncbi:TonB-dependent receptor plug domain-containing protein [uncultured Tenacibaculum sp.]|uniref:TonB-dependent receptor plug domain-containing protein n=1 Tax=uncultured Tenacibaculum sp. TaxID=174713 RepID=UPI002622AAB9|nr:TonB-dependent receptor plug domain-containing protein [uncultured Tenacibaculum sp.]